MTIDSPSVGDGALVPTDRAKASIARALGVHMGEGRRFSGNDVASATGMIQILQPFERGAA